MYIDVWGPANVHYLRDSRYYVTLIDKFTWTVWVYFLKNKFDEFATLNRWISEVENETSVKIKCLILTMEVCMIARSSRILYREWN